MNTLNGEAARGFDGRVLVEFMTLRSLIAVLATLLFCLPTSARARPDDEQRLQRYRYDFASAQDGLLKLDGELDAIGGHPAYLVIAQVINGAAETPQVVTVQPYRGTGTYGSVLPSLGCQRPLICTSSGPGHLAFRFTGQVVGDRHTLLRIQQYLVAVDGVLNVRVAKAQRWTIRPISHIGKEVTGSEIANLGFSTSGRSIESDRGYRVPSDTQGSLLVVLPPCDVLGAGALSVSGGRGGRKLVLCPTGPFMDVALSRTTWSVESLAVGMSDSPLRALTFER